LAFQPKQLLANIAAPKGAVIAEVTPCSKDPIPLRITGAGHQSVAPKLLGDIH